jgi:EAL domain-containing protein (putative c-di-GMP-specific phosphodiesterase class I)
MAANRTDSDAMGQPPDPAPAAGAEVIGRYDHITRLPNRVPFLERLAEQLADMRRDHRARTLLLVTLADAQHFNQILRALGHAFAEDFIRAGAQRVAACVQPDIQVHCVSVLSFAFIMARDGDPAPSDVAHAIQRRFAYPVAVENIPIQTRVGIGLVDLDPDVAQPAEALRSALTAAQDSRHGHTPFADYNPRTDAAHQRAFRILTDIPHALEARDQLGLRFQPRLDLGRDRTVSAEALLRWHHPELGWISPGEVMPLVETTALIRHLTRFVLDAAIAQVRAWRDAGRDLRVSVNVAPANLAEADFLDRLQSTLDRHGVAPTALELEFTEGALSPDDDRTLAHLRALRERGITVAIDDFGSGYSNMAYLTKIPADVVKIDKAFILNLDSKPEDRFITQRIADLARGLGFAVVGEGVESAWSYGFLRDIGCREAQGFYLSKPVTADDLAAWLSAGKTSR